MIIVLYIGEYIFSYCRCYKRSSIYFIWAYHYKSIAEHSYSLLRGSDFSLEKSLPETFRTVGYFNPLESV
jgi:hypothetical protein